MGTSRRVPHRPALHRTTATLDSRGSEKSGKRTLAETSVRKTTTTTASTGRPNEPSLRPVSSKTSGPENLGTRSSESSAKKALRVALAAIRALKENRTPEPWEAKALAAGWTPPKRSR